MLTTRDPLTGMLVAPVFLELLAHELDGAMRYGAPSLVVVQVRSYDEWVEQAGALRVDLVLRGLGAVLRSSARRSDALGVLAPGRVGLLLPRTDRDSARVVTRRVQERCERLRLSELVVGLVHDPTATDPDALLRQVDEVVARASRA